MGTLIFGLRSGLISLNWYLMFVRGIIVSNVKLQVKYLGEEGTSTPVGAAAAVNCPWDLLVRCKAIFHSFHMLDAGHHWNSWLIL